MTIWLLSHESPNRIRTNRIIPGHGENNALNQCREVIKATDYVGSQVCRYETYNIKVLITGHGNVTIYQL